MKAENIISDEKDGTVTGNIEGKKLIWIKDSNYKFRFEKKFTIWLDKNKQNRFLSIEQPDAFWFQFHFHIQANIIFLLESAHRKINKIKTSAVNRST